MGLKLRVLGGASAIVLAACAGGDDNLQGRESGLCEVRWGDSMAAGNDIVQRWTMSMSDDTREVSLEGWEQSQSHRFDAEGKLTRSEYSGLPMRPAADYVYDAHDRMVRVDVFGEPGAACTNTYDDDARLIERECRDSHYLYGYGQGDRIETLQSVLSGGDVIETTLSYNDDDQIVAIETDDSAYTFAYRADGQLERKERDWVFGAGSDGTFDIRWTWTFRADGSVEALEQDGTDHNDAPVIDGEADLRWTFSAGCKAIGEAHPWIYLRDAIIDVGMPMPRAPY